MTEEPKSPWPGPAGLIPVTSGRADDANLWNRGYLDRIHVEMRIIDAVKPQLKTVILGRDFSSPIMMPAFSHLNKAGLKDRTPMEDYALAAKELGTLNWIGMEDDAEFDRISACGAPTVRIIKPFADHALIISQIKHSEQKGAFAVGIDVDHVPGNDGGCDVVDGIPLGPVSSADLIAYIKITSLPFIVKGVLSVSDARKAADAGAAAIVVSHHHGRVPFGIAPAQVLPQICKALKGSKTEIFADCGIDTGYDAYKLLALGAKAVSVGRGILRPLLKEGGDGVVQKVRRMNAELSELMFYTGIADTGSFDPSVLWI